MSSGTFTIGEAAKAAGVTARAARLYEARGLIDAGRSASGYRQFTEDDVETLAFIRRARGLGLSLDAVAEIVELAETGPPCDRTRALLAERVTQIDAAMDDLTRLKATIVRAQQTRCGTGNRCGVIEQTDS